MPFSSQFFLKKAVWRSAVIFCGKDEKLRQAPCCINEDLVAVFLIGTDDCLQNLGSVGLFRAIQNENTKATKKIKGNFVCA